MYRATERHAAPSNAAPSVGQLETAVGISGSVEAGNLFPIIGTAGTFRSPGCRSDGGAEPRSTSPRG